MRITLNIVAVLLVLSGAIWFLQGINVLPGSFMTGQTRWADSALLAAQLIERCLRVNLVVPDVGLRLHISKKPRRVQVRQTHASSVLRSVKNKI
jgi:hypothetical protein